MREEKFESWEAFRSLVRGERFAVPVYWRGQVERRWPLSSSMERVILRHIEDMAPVESARKDVIAVLARQGLVANLRQAHLSQFKRAASGLRGPNPAELTDDQWWALGRHYGLFSPLLDWSENPYIAAFFALTPLQDDVWIDSDAIKERGVAIYRLVHEPCLEDEHLRILNIQVDEVPRLRGQRATFTLLESEHYFDLQSYLEDTARGHVLTRIVLSGNALEEGLMDVEDHGIDYSHLFPDLPGAAMHANVAFQRTVVGIDRPVRLE